MGDQGRDEAIELLEILLLYGVPTGGTRGTSSDRRIRPVTDSLLEALGLIVLPFSFSTLVELFHAGFLMLLAVG